MSEAALRTFPEHVAQVLRARSGQIQAGWLAAMEARAAADPWRMAPVRALARLGPELVEAVAAAVEGQAPDPPRALVTEISRLTSLTGQGAQGLESLQALHNQVCRRVHEVVTEAAGDEPPPDALHEVTQRIGAFHLALLQGIRWGESQGSLRSDLQQTAALQSFIRTLNHELRNHIYALQMQVRLLREPKFFGDEARRVQVLDRMKAALGEMSGVSERVLATQAATSAAPRARVRPLSDAVAELADDLVAHARAHGVALRVEGLPDTPVQVEPLQLAITHGVVNAIHFKDPGQAAPEVVVSGRLADEGLVVEIRDNGSGIPASSREAMFAYGSRGNHPQIPGEGRGLWETRRAVEGVGGTVALDEAPGGGTVLRMVLPKA